MCHGVGTNSYTLTAMGYYEDYLAHGCSVLCLYEDGELGEERLWGLPLYHTVGIDVRFYPCQNNYCKGGIIHNPRTQHVNHDVPYAEEADGGLFINDSGLEDILGAGYGDEDVVVDADEDVPPPPPPVPE